MDTSKIPAGYWQDANGNLVPESKVTELDKLRNQVVTDLCRMAQEHAAGLREFKAKSFEEMAAFVALSLERYGVTVGGEKGNATLTSFDGRYRVARHVQDRIVFGEELIAAKILIDECVRAWSKDANSNILALVNHAFQTDKEGKINVGRVLSLRRLDIRDEKWRQAMTAIADSMQAQSSKAYVRFWERNDATGAYLPISLDMAAV